MTMPLRFETLLPSILDTTVNAFKSGAKDVANNILMNLIFSFKEQNNELKEQLHKLEKEPTISISLDTQYFHDTMISLEDILEKLLLVTREYREHSEIFNELHKICEEMYANSITLSNEVSAVASETRHKEFKLAS